MKLKDLNMPVIQLAVDLTDMDQINELFYKLYPIPDRVIIEAGTPLIKKYGIDVVRKLKEISGGAFIVADLKTLDVGSLEVTIAAEGGADAAVVAGLAPLETIESFIKECRRRGLVSFVDNLGNTGFGPVLKKLESSPDVLVFHRGIDEEDGHQERVIEKVSGPMRAIAGGLTANEITSLPGFDIYIVGRYVTSSSDPKGATMSLLQALKNQR